MKTSGGIGEAWLYLIDDEVLETVLRADPGIERPGSRPVKSRGVSNGVSLYLDGKVNEALAELETVASQSAGDGPEAAAEACGVMGQILFETQRPETAAECFRKQLELAPRHAAARYNLAICLERSGRWSEARDVFEAASLEPQARPETLLGLAICQLHCGEPRKALSAAEKFLKVRPDHETAQFARAVSLQKLERFEEAREAYSELQVRRYESSELHTNMIALGLASQDYAMVQEHAGRLLASKRNSRPALEGLLASALARGEWEEAGHYASELLKAVPDSFEAWFNRGVAAQRQGQAAEAAEAYRRATELHPRDATSWVNLALVRWDAGDTVGARMAYEKARDIGPETPGAVWNLALLAARQNEVPAAEELLEQVLREWPEMEEAWFETGSLRLAQQHWVEAALAFEKCLSRKPDWPEAQFNAGLAYWRSEDALQARLNFEKAAAAGGDIGREAATALAILATEWRDVSQALRWLERSQGEAAAETYYNTALLLDEAGLCDEAQRMYREALKRNPEFTEAMINLGLALQASGHDDEARDLWERAKELTPQTAGRYFATA